MKGEETKKRILDVASELFWADSFHAVSMSDVAKGAGVNKATMYQYFASKSDLVTAVIVDARRKGLAYTFDGTWQQETSAAARLRCIYKRVYDVQKQDFDKNGIAPGCPFVNIAMSLSAEHAEARAEIVRTFEVFGTYYRQLVQELAPTPLPAALEDQAVSDLIRNMNGALTAAKIECRPEAVLDALPAALALAQPRAV